MGETAEGRGGAVAASAREQAITGLYERDAGTVKRLVARRTRVPDAVLDDACHTAWERLWSHHEVSLQPAAAVRWLVVTASRQAWRQYRREIPVGSLQANVDEGEFCDPVGEAADPVDVAVAREHTRLLARRLQALSARERRFLAMHAAGLSYREISAQTGSTLRTVERQILRGRRKLRD